MRFLYIEDIPLNAIVLSKYTEKFWNIKLEHALDAESGLAMITNNQYDLIFMDINLPQMDGIEATRHIRNEFRQPKLPILVVTADASEQTKKLALDAGANALITKPLKPAILQQAVEDCLKGS